VRHVRASARLQTGEGGQDARIGGVLLHGPLAYQSAPRARSEAFGRVVRECFEGQPRASWRPDIRSVRWGPCTSRLEIFPPRLEIEEAGGLYVLIDEGPIDDWKYQFLTSGRVSRVSLTSDSGLGIRPRGALGVPGNSISAVKKRLSAQLTGDGASFAHQRHGVVPVVDSGEVLSVVE
jgi:hypothetical protein